MRMLKKFVKRPENPQRSQWEVVRTILTGCQHFMTLDAFKGYQVKLNPEFRKFTAFQTPFGRYRYIRLAMGLSSALDIFTTRYSNVVINTIGGRCTEDTLIQHNVDQEERQHQS
jgi:hypothetical protein